MIFCLRVAYARPGNVYIPHRSRSISDRSVQSSDLDPGLEVDVFEHTRLGWIAGAAPVQEFIVLANDPWSES